METISLFPLGTVLLPHGRMALQIFEPRYLELISRCLKQDDGAGAGFGVVWLREGSEVHRVDSKSSAPRFAQIGTFASIVDWDSLPNGLLGITIEGGKTFRLVSSYQRPDFLHMADVEWLDDDAVIPLPEKSEELQQLLGQLLDHPHVERLQLTAEINDAGTLANVLTQLLPIPEQVKFELLVMTHPLLRLEKLMDILDQFNR